MPAGSDRACAKLEASGVTFQTVASTTPVIISHAGRQRRSETASSTIGSAAYRSRSTFEPSADGTMYATRQAAR